MSLPAILAENIKLKALSFLFAAVLVAFVHLEAKDEAEIPLQVSYLNIPAGMVLQAAVDSRPVLRIAGPRILLLRQRLTGVTVSLDLRGRPAGKVPYNSLDSYLSLHPGVTLLRVIPATSEPVLVPGG